MVTTWGRQRAAAPLTTLNDTNNKFIICAKDDKADDAGDEVGQNHRKKKMIIALYGHQVKKASYICILNAAALISF